MEQCGISTEGGESTESVSPVSGVSGWCSLDTHSGYISPTSVAPVCLQSMNIIRRDLGDRLNKLLLYKSEMATADESSDIVYANSTPSGPESIEVKTKFEDRFQFRRGSDLPPPLPPHSPNPITLPRI